VVPATRKLVSFFWRNSSIPNHAVVFFHPFEKYARPSNWIISLGEIQTTFQDKKKHHRLLKKSCNTMYNTLKGISTVSTGQRRISEPSTEVLQK